MKMKTIIKIFAFGAIGIVSILCLTGCGSSYSDTSSYSGGSSSSSYKSSNPADYDSKGRYKPVETMTQEEKKQELIDIMSESIY